MLPAHIAENIRKQILYYLQSTFEFRDRAVERQFEAFLNDPENGMFKGPWVTLRRPYRPAPDGLDLPFDIQVPFHPFRHQYRAWRRLSSKGQSPVSTLVTTGTGSGKTECFLFPVLDHCLRARKSGQKGIKAIVLYPMNALAADQEKRFAKTVWKHPALKAAGVTVGTYTGRYDAADPGVAADSGTRAMGPEHGISHHETLQVEPPDILLTNYKMLDFLLMRPQDQRLWRFNDPQEGADPVLRYLVLDELHTYDGAQGSDVACLIRRLKERMGAAKGRLCCVGTSATLQEGGVRSEELGVGEGQSAVGSGSGPSAGEGYPNSAIQIPKCTAASDVKELASDRLARFASTLFEEVIPPEAVIGEERLEVEEIVRGGAVELTLPAPESCEPGGSEDAEAYAMRQARVWGAPECLLTDSLSDKQREAEVTAWRVALGEWLKTTRLFRHLLELFREVERKHEAALTWTELVRRLAQRDLAFGALPDFEARHCLVVSFFALVAHAQERRGEDAYPLVPTQVQLWIRELRRLGRVVAETPVFAWLDEPPPNQLCLPTFQCSECGESGWIGLRDPKEDAPIAAKGVDGFRLGDDASAIYSGWFGRDGEKEDSGRRDQNIVVVSPWGDDEEDSRDGHLLLDSERDYFCPASLVIRKGSGPCPVTADMRRFRVRVNRETDRDEKSGHVYGAQGCPRCGSRLGVFIVGCQSATLASVAIDEMFGSVLNDDPKLLAFTDSVQDASHRAGFFTSRTYHFTFRTALRHVIDEAGPEGLLLPEVGPRLLAYWSQRALGRPGSQKEAIAALLPPDLAEYEPWLAFRDDAAAVQAPEALRREVEARLTWEATSEFGLMQTHGRTMEPSGSATLGWEPERIGEAVSLLRTRLPVAAPTLAGVDDAQLRLWVLGMLQRYRERGGLYHPYLDAFARQNFWGKFPFGRAVAGRETYPPAGRYKPHLLVTLSQREHEFVLAQTRGNQSPWHIKWARRAFRSPGLEEAAALDLIRAFLRVGEEAGLLRKLHQDGAKEYYALEASAARLFADVALWRCSESGRALVRPEGEAGVWDQSPSLEYYSERGAYARQAFTQRQRYYQDRYRKGALRRVVAHEHTGLLATEAREKLERGFARAEHADAPNVLTCTSTLEMGIDIGDLSSTMLCSMPPSTASYLQRVGRAGRATGTALILSIVNQRPHDLFFYARPEQMLKGRVEPPGCWLDASAVLSRQYLAFCLDCATYERVLTELPYTARQLAEDLARPDGIFPKLLAWVTENEAVLRDRFLRRLADDVMDDTRGRFIAETNTDLLRQRIHQAANAFEKMRRELVNAQKRLQEQLKTENEEECEDEREFQREIKILKGRLSGMGRVSALELLTDHGLLPNYAFPERGVRFYGAVYDRYRDDRQERKPIELSRAAGVALKELAPGNVFYTQRRQFDIQQLAVGNPQQPLTERWAICGSCGHMRRTEELQRPEASPACPQCGGAEEGLGQADVGQQRAFVEFSQSQALSYMEHYESLSGDRSEERQRQIYQTVHSLDHTIKAPSGAVGEDTLPFGIEYRAAMVMREVNTGYPKLGMGTLPFGPDQEASEEGFLVCPFCGIVVPPGANSENVNHRRSCQARRQAEKLRQEGKAARPLSWEHIYLYRQLRSEAIRLLLPLTDDEDIYTLSACLHLGLRLRFEGNPAHLLVLPQVLPELATGVNRHYLVLMDAVPGGTGYLKTLYQEKDGAGREGEGLLDVLRRALVALETCACRKMRAVTEQEDTDGCYRCIRAYHLQYRAEQISRERGIVLLRKLIGAGDARTARQALTEIKPDSLFGSVLEKRFVDRLRGFVEQRQGTWEKTIIKGGQGFRFSLPGSRRLWELELQPTLGSAQGILVQSQPDFLLRCDEDGVKPVAVFTDGFQFHCYPNNRLADDLRKRRAILASGGFAVWAVTWADLEPAGQEQNLVCHAPLVEVVDRYAAAMKRDKNVVPDVARCLRNGFQQLTAYLECPQERAWQGLASFALFWPLQMLMTKRAVGPEALTDGIRSWQSGGAFPALRGTADGIWVYNDRVALTADWISWADASDLLGKRTVGVAVAGRLGNSQAAVAETGYEERWRRFLCCMNLYQFCTGFQAWATSECEDGFEPEMSTGKKCASEAWQVVIDEVTTIIRSLVQGLSQRELPVPSVAYYDDAVGEEAFAELAWPDVPARLALLIGDQAFFADRWRRVGWRVVTLEEALEKGPEWLAEQVRAEMGRGV